MFVVYTFILTTGTDLSGSTDTTFTPNGYTLINTNPYYFVRSGNVRGSTLNYFIGRAYYWSSTAVSSTSAYGLIFHSGGIWPADDSLRSSGWSLRCVAGYVPIYHLQILWLAGDFSILTTGADLSGSTDITYTPNGYTLINTNPYYFVRSGSVNGSTLYRFTGYADYWSSTAVSASQAYDLDFGSGVVYPADRDHRGRGRSLRCVTDAKMIVNCKNML